MAEYQKQKKILQQLEKARAAIKNKNRLLKLGKAGFEKTLDETFKPIVSPLEKLVDIASKQSPPLPSYSKNAHETFTFDDDDSLSQASFRTVVPVDANSSFFLRANEADEEQDVGEEEEEVDEGDSAKKYLTLLKQNRKRYLDKLYGVRRIDKDTYAIGNSSIVFEKHGIKVDGVNFPKSTGLLELLFRKDPDKSLIKPNDLKSYKEILEISSAHRKNYDPNEPLRTYNSNKFIHIITPLFKKGGKGIPPPFKTAHSKSRTDYVYWDDPNELVDRLRLLCAEQDAGNNNHRNEILSIIEELREGGYIY